MSEIEDERNLIVEDRSDGLHIGSGDEHGNPLEILWPLTKEALHTWLSWAGFKRAGKQKNSDIGGVYTK